MVAFRKPIRKLSPVKQRGATINGPVLRVCRLRLLGDKLDGKPTIARVAGLIDVTPQLWSQWENGGRGISDEKLDLLVDLFDFDGPEPLLASTADEVHETLNRQRARRNKAVAA